MIRDSTDLEKRDPSLDLITGLGELALATRLRRLSDRLSKDISRVYAELDVEFEARWFAVLYLLGHRSPLSVTDIAAELRLTHPAINQITTAMARQQLVSSRRDRADERRRLISLTAKGRATIDALQPIWEIISDCTREAILQAGGDLLSVIGKVEQALDGDEMYTRVIGRIRAQQIDRIEIVDYEPRYKKHFKSLNYEWLQEHFRVEPIDEALLGDPNGQILKRGGDVLFARIDGAVVGTVALLPHDTATYELAKMAVAPAARRRQVGRCLARAALERAQKKGARRVILETSPKLVAALELYRSLGFRRVSAKEDERSDYERVTFTMELDLTEKAA